MAETITIEQIIESLAARITKLEAAPKSPASMWTRLDAWIAANPKKVAATLTLLGSLATGWLTHYSSTTTSQDNTAVIRALNEGLGEVHKRLDEKQPTHQVQLVPVDKPIGNQWGKEAPTIRKAGE